MNNKFKFAIEPRASATKQAFDNPIMISQSDFSGGINKSRLQTTIDIEKEVFEAINTTVNISSHVVTRGGMSNVGEFETDPTNPGYPNGIGIQGIGEYKEYALLATGGEVYKFTEIINEDPINKEISKVATDVTFIGNCHPTNKVNFVQFHGYVLIMDGGTLKRYDDLNFELIPNAPCIRDGIIIKDRFWGMGEEGIFNVGVNASGYYDAELGIYVNGYYEKGVFNPTAYTGSAEECHSYTVYVCGPNDLEDWGYNGEQLGTFFEFDPYVVSTSGEPNRITGISTFSESIIVFKIGENPRIYRIDGSDTSSFQTTLLVEGSACWNENTVAASSIGLFYLAKDGVFVLTGGQEIITLASSKFNKKMLEDLKNPNVEGIYDPTNGLYVIGSGKVFYVFNIYTKGWFKWELNVNSSCIRYLERGIYIGSDKGNILFYNTTSDNDYSVVDDEQVPVYTLIETAAYNFQQPGVSKFIKYCYIIFDCYKDVEVDIEFFAKQASLIGVGAIDEYDIYNQKSISATDSTRVSLPDIKTIKINIEDPEVYWDDSMYIFDSTLTQSILSYMDQMYPWDGNDMYVWDATLPPIEGDASYTDYLNERVILESQLGIFYTYYKLRFDGRGGNIVQLKLPVGIRATDIAVRLNFKNAPIMLQELIFDGASTRPAP